MAGEKSLAWLNLQNAQALSGSNAAQLDGVCLSLDLYRAELFMARLEPETVYPSPYHPQLLTEAHNPQPEVRTLPLNPKTPKTLDP